MRWRSSQFGWLLVLAIALGVVVFLEIAIGWTATRPVDNIGFDSAGQYAFSVEDPEVVTKDLNIDFFDDGSMLTGAQPSPTGWWVRITPLILDTGEAKEGSYRNVICSFTLPSGSLPAYPSAFRRDPSSDSKLWHYSAYCRQGRGSNSGGGGTGRFFTVPSPIFAKSSWIKSSLSFVIDDLKSSRSDDSTVAYSVQSSKPITAVSVPYSDRVQVQTDTLLEAAHTQDVTAAGFTDAPRIYVAIEDQGVLRVFDLMTLLAAAFVGLALDRVIRLTRGRHRQESEQSET